MREISIDLIGSRRADGSVIVTSPDLPMFNVVGTSDDEAFNNAMDLLPEYLTHNVPEYVDFRRVPSALEVISDKTPVLSAHIVARMGKENNGTDGSATS